MYYACVCASRGKYTLRDTLSQSQCYASSKNSSSLATSEPPTLPAHRLATKNLFSQRKQFQSPSPISHGFSKCSFRTLFWQECMIFVLYVFSSFVVKLHMVIMLTNSSKKKCGRKKEKHFDQSSSQCGVHCRNTHTHTVIKMTLTRFEACPLTCNEAFQHPDLFLGLCLRACEFRGVCMCVGFVYWSIRRRGGRRRNCDRKSWQQWPNHLTGKCQKSRPSRKIKTACRHHHYTVTRRRNSKVKEERKCERLSSLV